MESEVRTSRRVNGRSRSITWAARGLSAVAGTVIAGVLIASPAAAADKPVPPNTTNPKPAAPAKGLGEHEKRKSQKIVRAVVESDATLVKKQSFGATSATKLGTGVYQVCFAVPINKGTYVASIGIPGNVGVPPAGEISVVGRVNTDNCLYIQTFNSAGTLTDRGFHVVAAYSKERRH
ncbi:hypothetical protein [Streptomyces sp. WMMB 322]|uniref:hypothetical protein n=1 Tax=Streptomyces sp. WMMB 322 TaxID=1286821 RepID=UPI0006E15884|nr:hypothetical protein [Streptomyces sp. WMMB 322]SCK44682.1 hypothetical protein H180DRAFT_03949 [Streptomyces sp. WMMB 322]